MMNVFFLSLIALVAVVSSQVALEATAVYSVDGCESDYEHHCFAYFCVDTDQQVNMLIGATTLVMGSPVSVSEYAGIAVWGYTNADLSLEPDNAVTQWSDTSNSSDWSTISLTITYRVGDADAYSEVYNLTLDAVREFAGTETCLWFPESNGFYDGKFAIELGTGEAFSFYVCGEFEGETFSQFNGQAYGGLTIPLGNIQMQYFINISGYFVEYNGRRFYHGYTNVVSASQNGGDCDSENGFIFDPRTNPLLIAVTDDVVPGTIQGWTTNTDISGGFPDGIASVTITGSPEEPIAKPRFCVTSPEYLEVCEGVDPYSTEPVEVTTTTYEELETTYDEIVSTFVEETGGDDDDDSNENAVALFLPALISLAVMTVF